MGVLDPLVFFCSACTARAWCTCSRGEAAHLDEHATQGTVLELVDRRHLHAAAAAAAARLPPSDGASRDRRRRWHRRHQRRCPRRRARLRSR